MWKTKAKARLEALPTKATPSTEYPPLLEWIPQVSPENESPTHLAPVAEVFDDIRQGATGIKLAFSVPPRHWKTTTILHGVAELLLALPGIRVCYLSYNDDAAERKARDLARIIRRAGGRYSRFTFAEAELENGSFFRAAGILSGVTGEGFDLVIVDDPYRKRADAESATVRKRTSESFRADIFTRQGNTPTSFIVLHTRWHVDDLIAELKKPESDGGYGFPWLNLKAVNDNGEALLPKWWPVERLRPFMANAYEWASNFQGEPVSRGRSVFGPPTYCQMADLPLTGYRASIGVDLAYSEKTKADYSVRIDLRLHGGKVYVANVIRKQVRAPDFAPVLTEARDRYPGAPIVWHASGTEKGSADFIIRLGVPLRVLPARGDKFQRAQEVAAAWNGVPIEIDGRLLNLPPVLVPADAPWAPQFVDEVCAFSGDDSAHDDQVDALVSAFASIRTGAAGSVGGGGERRAAGARSAY